MWEAESMMYGCGESTLRGAASCTVWLTLSTGRYFGQAAAQQDCAFRAMKDGHRWVFNGDWDEFLALVPANARPWPPPATSSLSSPFSDW